jgi:hypothetical protein
VEITFKRSVLVGLEVKERKVDWGIAGAYIKTSLTSGKGGFVRERTKK